MMFVNIYLRISLIDLLIGFVNLIPKQGSYSDPSNWRPIGKNCSEISFKIFFGSWHFI